MSSNGEKQLPSGWTETSLGELLTVLRGVSYKKEDATTEPAPGKIPILRATNIDANLNFDNLVYVPQKYVSEVQLLNLGDIVIAASSGSRHVVGKAAALTVPWAGSFGAFCYGLRPYHQETASYISLFLQTSTYRDYVSVLSAGVNINNLRREHIEGTPLPIPPLNEQRRIVAKIEELFSELDKGIESLKTARAQLNVYRQAVLKHAFEGKLTAQWREENKDKLETPEQLRARIKQEREAHYEQQLKEWKAARGKGSKPKASKSLPLLTAEELAELPELPKGWVWTRFGLLDIELKRGPFGSSITKSMFVPSGFKVYEQGNAIYRDASKGSYFINDEKYKELSGFTVLPSDFIVSCAGTVGRIFELPENAIAGVINQALMRVRINNTILSKRFFAKLFESAFFQRKILSDAKGTAMVNLAGIKELNLVPVAICSMSEQKVIDRLLDALLLEVDQCERTITTSLQQAEVLRQSILKRAFAGQLVPQDPHDESASALLDRIKAEREKVAKNSHPKKTKKRKTTA